MKATIDLRRPAVARAWCFHGEVGVPQPRPWAVAIAKLAAANGRSIQTEDVSNHLLDGRVPMARGLIKQCCAWGMLDASGDAGFTLTELGQKAAETNKVFIPETGTWIIWTSEDEVIGGQHPLLLLERWIDPDALEETGANWRAGANRKFIQAPEWLTNLVGSRASFPLGRPHQDVHFFSISEQVEERWDDHLDIHLHLECSPADSILYLAGNVKVRQPGGDKKNGPRFDTYEVKSAPWPVSLLYAECWSVLMESQGLKQVWDDERKALRVPFPEDERERNLRRGARSFNYPTIPNLGQFDTTQIKDIPLCPATQFDAQQWSEWSLLNKIDTYATRSRFDRWVKDAMEPFLDWQPVPPARKELAAVERGAYGRAPTPRYWNLQAPCDWNL